MYFFLIKKSVISFGIKVYLLIPFDLLPIIGISSSDILPTKLLIDTWNFLSDVKPFDFENIIYASYKSEYDIFIGFKCNNLKSSLFFK